MDEAAATAHVAIFANMGQVCTAGSRLFVHEDIYDTFVNKVVEMAKNRRIGDPFDLASESGPQVHNIMRPVIKGHSDEGTPSERRKFSVSVP